MAIYGKHLEDMENYDLFFNTGIQTYEQVTEILIGILKGWDQRATVEGRQKLAHRALTAKVKARLFTHPGIFIPSLEVENDGSSIILKGLVHNPKEYHLIEEVAQEAAGDFPLKNEMHYR